MASVKGGLKGAGKGALTGAGIGSIVPGVGTLVGAGVGGVVGGIKGLFGGGDDDDEKDKDVDDAQALRDASAGQREKGKALGAAGQQALNPAMSYFKDQLGADPSALMSATKGARGRVIDQYDTARQAAARFGPKGGGTNQAIASSYFQQANQLSDITSAAQNDAATQLGQLGATVTGLGLSADQLASADLSTVIQAVLGQQQLDLTKRGQTMDLFGNLGSAAGDIIGGVLMGGGGSAATT